ncbi:hypothetical protein KAR91_50300 [Candidatus Pacearchaeota archaeon]|nr:hypothetical protein [Candidatus Pacearchaeota archaeon]
MANLFCSRCKGTGYIRDWFFTLGTFGLGVFMEVMIGDCNKDRLDRVPCPECRNND